MSAQSAHDTKHKIQTYRETLDAHLDNDDHQAMPSPQLERHGGYMAAASWLSRDPDNETLIFRKFNRLGALNLLYLQSEVMELETKLADLHLQTVTSYDMGLREAASNWEALKQQCQPGTFRNDAKERMDLIKELRSKLKEYNEALVLQYQVANLKRPNKRSLAAVRHYFERPYHLLGGKAKTFLQDRDDLATPRLAEESDYLSQFLKKHWKFDKELSRDGQTHFARFNEHTIALVVNIITILIAGIFLIGSIATFYFLRPPAAKLAMIAVFTIGFASSVALVTNARRVELFAATAAYAAVLVVFVSNSDLSQSSSGA